MLDNVVILMLYMNFAKKHNLRVIEDASHAFGNLL